MCNPPFFASSQETNPLFKARKPDRPKPKNAFCATVTEVVAKGGEVEFVSRIVKESKEIKDKIKYVYFKIYVCFKGLFWGNFLGISYLV